MTIAVTTPTGNVGRHVTRVLTQAGVCPRVLLRDPASIPTEARKLVDAVEIDQLDQYSVIKATAGIDTIFWVDPPTELDDPQEGYRLATEALIAAIKANGIKRIVFQSSVGAELRHGVGDIDGLAFTETALDELAAQGGSIDVTHLRCGYFFTNLLMDIEAIKQGIIVTAMDIDQSLPWVAPQDIAAVACARLLSRSWSGRHVQAIHGPADLSYRDVTQILSKVIGNTITVTQVNDDAVRSELTGFGMTAKRVEAIVQMTAGIRDGFIPENPRDYTTTTPTELAAWVYSNLVPHFRNDYFEDAN